jgi:hypothetical protein
MSQIKRYAVDRMMCPVCSAMKGKEVVTQHYCESNGQPRTTRRIFCEHCRVLRIQIRNNPSEPWN